MKQASRWGRSRNEGNWKDTKLHQETCGEWRTSVINKDAFRNQRTVPWAQILCRKPKNAHPLKQGMGASLQNSLAHAIRSPVEIRTRETRSRLHRQAVFDSMGEARSMPRILQPEGKLRVCAYCCPLCHHLHVADRRVVTSYRRVLKNHSRPASSPQSSTGSFRGLLESESPGSLDGLEITPGLVTLRG
jgi:hypothetical protein